MPGRAFPLSAKPTALVRNFLWFDSLPINLQAMIDADHAKAAGEVTSCEVASFNKARERWAEHGEFAR